MIPEDVVEVGGLRFSGGAGDHGFFIESEGIVGWDDSPPVRFNAVERADADGDFDLDKVLYSARILTVSGLCYARNSQELGVFRNRLMGLPTTGVRATVTTFGTTTYADGGTIASASKFEVVVPGRIARYQFSRRFSDPRRYGTRNDYPANSDGLARAFHFGNAGAYSQLVVRGTADRWRVAGPSGRSVLVNRTLDPVKAHVYDMATGLLVFDGDVIRAGSVEQADTWTVPPGVRVSHTLSFSGGSATLEVRTPDTYI